jgi:hypothetical protein
VRTRPLQGRRGWRAGTRQRPAFRGAARSTGRRAAAPAGVVVAALVAGLAGCAGSGGPLAGLTADQIVAKAIKDMNSEPTVAMSGAFSASGTPITLDLTLTHGKGCSGTVSEQGAGSVQLIKVGSTLWIKADSKFWASEQVTSASVVQAVSGKYVQTGSGSSMAQLGNLCDTSQLVGAMGTSYQGMSEGPTTTISGRTALKIRSSDDAVFYVSVIAAPLLLRVDGGSAGYLNFSYSGTPRIAPPPASQTVNGAQYGL